MNSSVKFFDACEREGMLFAWYYFVSIRIFFWKQIYYIELHICLHIVGWGLKGLEFIGFKTVRISHNPLVDSSSLSRPTKKL